MDEFSEAQQHLDDLKDQAEITGIMSPRDYAKLRGIYPQRVYYSIRHGQLADRVCDCGRRVIRVTEADELYGFKSVQQGIQKASETYGEDLEA
jgi:hypothetical protein